jgi:hypothetical protein
VKAHLKYFAYVVRHKWFVLLEGIKLGVPLWMLLLHDWDKFLPSEWLPYVQHFYRNGRRGRTARSTGYFKADDIGDAAFDEAVLRHIRRNKHHWEYWIDRRSRTPVIFPMPDVHRREMLADWRGAGRAQGTSDNRGWYLANQNRLALHSETRAWVETMLAV